MDVLCATRNYLTPDIVLLCVILDNFGSISIQLKQALTFRINSWLMSTQKLEKFGDQTRLDESKNINKT